MAAVAACAAVLAAGCGGGKVVTGGPPEGRPVVGTPSSVVVAPPSPSTAAPRGNGGGGAGSVASRVPYFSAVSPARVGVHEVLRSRAALERFAGKAAAGDAKAARTIAASGEATDFSRSTLVGWTATTGCSSATSARLEVTGDRLELRVSRPEAPPECLAAFHVTVVFEVPRERMPAHPVFG